MSRRRFYLLGIVVVVALVVLATAFASDRPDPLQQLIEQTD